MEASKSKTTRKRKLRSVFVIEADDISSDKEIDVTKEDSDSAPKLDEALADLKKQNVDTKGPRQTTTKVSKLKKSRKKENQKRVNLLPLKD